MATASYEALKTFFETAEVARKATRPLSHDAEVALQIDGGPAHFTMAGGKPLVAEGPATVSYRLASVLRVQTGDDVTEQKLETKGTVTLDRPAR